MADVCLRMLHFKISCGNYKVEEGIQHVAKQTTYCRVKQFHNDKFGAGGVGGCGGCGGAVADCFILCNYYFAIVMNKTKAETLNT